MLCAPNRPDECPRYYDIDGAELELEHRITYDDDLSIIQRNVVSGKFRIVIKGDSESGKDIQYASDDHGAAKLMRQFKEEEMYLERQVGIRRIRFVKSRKRRNK
jgi:hypothetical protein